MGTYTTNKNLFMPTVGEQGWGELVNNNFSTIDNFLKPITISGSTYTFSGNHVGNQSGGSISATSITNSGALTNTGKITANGGIGTTTLTTSGTITASGNINGVNIKSTITVTPNTTTVTTSSLGSSWTSYNLADYLWILPPIGLQKYNGSIKLYNPLTDRSVVVYYSTAPSLTSMTKLTIAKQTYGTITFNNASCLFAIAGSGSSALLCGFTLS